MDAEAKPTAEEAIEPRRAEIGETEEAASAAQEQEPLAVGNGSQVIAVTINLNLPIFGSVVYATRRAVPPGVGGKVFDIVRRVVGGQRPGAGPDVETD